LSEPHAIRRAGHAAIERGDFEAAAQYASNLEFWLKEEREAAGNLARLDALFERVKDLTGVESVRARAASLHRQGRWAHERSERQGTKDSIRELGELVARLSEEFTLIMTGGKWRFKNSDPSVRTYYVLVEAVAPNGAKLQQFIRNEEDGSGATVRQWGERVPFEIYERVRRDKQDNGRIDQDVFGRKPRGKLDLEMELRTDDGKIVPRTGQITRW
jgi:hypothetical protein